MGMQEKKTSKTKRRKKMKAYSIDFLFFKGHIFVFGMMLLLLVASCNSNQQTQTDENIGSVENTLLLLGYFEQNGQYINSNEIPSIVDASIVYALQSENILIIDLRPEDYFREGHIAHAVNLRPAEVLDYFINRIDPASFEKIFFTCNNGNASGHAAAVMRLLGYENVFAMRFGMSGWDQKIADKYWMANISSHLEGKMDFETFDKNPAGDYPAIVANATSARAILLERAAEALNLNVSDYTLSLPDFEKSPDAYYTICYWPLDKYTNNGHLPGAVQYDPKKSLSRDTHLNTLPLDKPIVVYCYSGQHSGFVAAYLQMLGYDAKSLAYGANGFIHETMARTEALPTRTFTAKLVQGYPVVKSGMELPVIDSKEIEKETITIQGGC
jgi:rhodanese-related sulfurtransferase